MDSGQAPHVAAMIQLALRHKRALKKAGGNYFDRSTVANKQWWRLHSQALVEQDPPLTGAALTARCQAHCNKAHLTMMEFLARSMLKDPARQFPHYFAAIANKPDYHKVARATVELRNHVEVAVGASMSEDSPI